jgi:hypothetical protein
MWKPVLDELIRMREIDGIVGQLDFHAFGLREATRR